jgi:prephenate dehydratase
MTGMTQPPYPRVAFQGELGAFSEDAIYTLWSSERVNLVPRPDCFAAARAVVAGEADYAVLPFENTLAGSVSEAYDALCENKSLCVIAETVIPIDQCILAAPGATLANMTVAHSHRIALAQCRGFLLDHPHIAASPVYDTAGAARDVAGRGATTECAIAGKAAARRYGLEVLAERIQDRHDNQTRFWALSPQTPERKQSSGASELAAHESSDRRQNTSVASGAHSQRQKLIICAGPFGSTDERIHRTMNLLHEHDLHVSHLEARPSGTPWEHYYVMEATYANSVCDMGDIEAFLDAPWLRLAGVIADSASQASSSTRCMA